MFKASQSNNGRSATRHSAAESLLSFAASTPQYLALEQRIVYDAAIAATVDAIACEATVATAQIDDTPLEVFDVQNTVALEAALSAPAGEVVGADADVSSSQVIVFVDAAVSDPQIVALAAPKGAEIIMLDGGRDGVVQITEALQGRSAIDAIHIVSHGGPGSLALGNGLLTLQSLTGEHADNLQTIGSAIADAGDIHLYGCDVAFGGQGAEFVHALAAATGADVAASVDLTGCNAAEGSNWELELETGTIESAHLVVEGWNGLLAPITITNVNGTSVTATSLAQEIAGGSITILNASYSGGNGQSGVFTSASGHAPAWLSFDDGIVLTTGTTNGILGPNTIGNSGVDAPGIGSDANLAAIGAGSSFDAAVLTFDFVPTTSLVTLQFTFGSEEYNEYVYSTFNDAMGIWINGVNYALNPSGTPISIDTVNNAATFAPASGSQSRDPDPSNGVFDSSAPNLYLNNPVGKSIFDTGMDGLTVTLSIVAPVTAGAVNTMKIGVSDIGDGAYDSYVFVKADSLVGVPIANTDKVVTGRDVPVVIDAIANDISNSTSPISITHVADKSIVAGGAAVVLTTGATVGLGLDGQLIYTPAAGALGADLLTYTVAGKSGGNAVGYIDIQVIDHARPLVDLDTAIAWQSGTSADPIPLGSYAGSTGLLAWTTPWIEIGDDGAAGSGDVKTTSDGARSVIEVVRGANGIQRSTDLSDFDIATLQFEYCRVSFDVFGDYVDVQASTDGTTFSTIGRLQGPANDVGYLAFSADISNFISPDTTIRFVSSGGFSVNDRLLLDNVAVTGAVPLTGYLGSYIENAPPTPIAAAGSVALIDADSASYGGATIKITNAHTSDSLSLAAVLPNSITATFNADATTLTLSGVATKSDYEVALQQVRFGSVGDEIAAFARKIEVVVTDETGLASKAAVALIAVVAVNDAPIDGDETMSLTEDVPSTVADGAAGDLLDNADDADGDALKISGYTIAGISGTQPVGSPVAIPGVGTLTIEADGSYNLSPSANYNGAVPLVTYTVSDGKGGTDTSTLSYFIAAANDAPVASHGGLTVAEDGTHTGILPAASDIDGDALVYAAGGTGPSHGAIVVNADGTFAYTPAADYFGADSFTYIVSDGTATIERTMSITVVPVNDAPVASHGGLTVAEDGTHTGTLPAASDIDGDVLVYAAGSTGPSHGAIVVNADGTFAYTPAADYFGADSFTYVVSDGTATIERTMSITVVPVNDAPVASHGGLTVAEDGTHTGTLPAASDIDGDALVYAAGSTGPSHGAIVVNADGTFAYTPAADYFGADSFTYIVSDGTATIERTMTVSVTAVPDPVLLGVPRENEVPPPPRIDHAIGGMRTDGILLRAVAALDDLESTQGLDADCIIVGSVNALSKLDSIAYEVPLLAGMDPERCGEIAHEAPSWTKSLETATGSALELGRQGLLDRQCNVASLMIETHLSRGTFSINVMHVDPQDWAGEIRIMRADGRPAPSWLEPVGLGMLAGRVPADVEAIDFMLIAIAPDGSAIERFIEVDTRNGVMLEVAPPSWPQLFLVPQQLMPNPALEELEIEALGHWLQR